MIPGIVGDQIRRSNRNVLVFNILMVGALVGIAFLARGFLYNWLMGPETVKAEDIAKMDPDARGRYWVRAEVGGNRFEDTYVVHTGSKGSKTYYHLVDLPAGALLVEDSLESPGPVVEGTLGSSGEKSDVLSSFVRPMGSPILPVMLNDSGIRFGGYLFLGFWTPVMLLGLWNIKNAVGRMGDPKRHPVCVVLKRFGEPEEIAVGIDAEFKAGADSAGNVKLTQSWLMRKRGFGMDLVYLGDVVWVYKKETKHRTNGIPTGTTYSSMVYDKYGAAMDFGLKKAQVDALLTNIHVKVPWVLVGFEKRLKDMWQKDRKSLLGLVEGRKEEYMKSAEGGGAPPGQN